MGRRKQNKNKIAFRKAVITPILKQIKSHKQPFDVFSTAKQNVRSVGKRNIRVPRVIPIPKQGGFLIPLISGLAALGGLISAGSSIAKVVKEVHAAKDQLSEAQRHNQTMEAIAIGRKGSGLYVKPYKKGFGLFINKKQKNFKISKKPLTNIQILKYAKLLQIPNFRGVYMRDKLPHIPNKYERAIVNLDDNLNNGTHWCAYIKNNNKIFWFDPFGDITPPEEIKIYFQNCLIIYNFNKFQSFGSSDCGKLCLEFLSNYKID